MKIQKFLLLFFLGFLIRVTVTSNDANACLLDQITYEIFQILYLSKNKIFDVYRQNDRIRPPTNIASEILNVNGKIIVRIQPKFYEEMLFRGQEILGGIIR